MSQAISYTSSASRKTSNCSYIQPKAQTSSSRSISSLSFAIRCSCSSARNYKACANRIALLSAMSSASGSGSGGVHSAAFNYKSYGLQFPIPDELDVGLHDHLARDGFDGEYWKEMGKRWRALCRRFLGYVSHQAGGSLHWMKKLAAQQAHEQAIEIYVETFSGRIITLPFDRSDLNRRRLSVHLIKKRIQQFEAIPFSQQQLMLNDCLLDDYDELDDYDKLEGSSLHLVVMEVNGSSHASKTK
jgi:hypothetical protein